MGTRRYGSVAIGMGRRRWVTAACSCGNYLPWLALKPGGMMHPAGRVLIGLFRAMHERHGNVRDVWA